MCLEQKKQRAEGPYSYKEKREQDIDFQAEERIIFF